jgi:DNA primase
MFPIQDQIGRVIAFGARKIKDEDEPKYLNSPETRVFEKSGTLYGLYQASREIQRRKVAVITEGYTDTIACHQAGLTNAVATLGTALTPRHATVLRRLCDTVVLLFDGDTAGQKAADRAVEVFFAEELDVKICTLAGHTDAKDPDELLKREGGLAVLQRAIDAAPDLLAYRYARIRERLSGAGLSAVNKAIEEELARLVQLGLAELPVLRRALIIKQLAAVAGVDEAVIARSVPAGRSAAFSSSATAELKPRALVSSPRLQALGCLLAEPNLWATLSSRDHEELDPMHFEPGASHDLADAMLAIAAERTRCGIQDVLAAIDAPEVQGLATDLALRMEQIGEGDSSRLGQYLRDCLRAAAETGRDRGAAASLEDLRRLHQSTGGNRRALPRPGGSSGRAQS